MVLANRWTKLREALRRRLLFARCFETKVLRKLGYNRHAEYLHRLQVGTAARNKTADWLLSSRVQQATAEAAKLARDGHVVTSVDDAAQLDDLQIWKQGDEALATAEAMRKRFKLRHEPEVHKVLAAFWDVMMRSVGKPGNAYSEVLNRESFFSLYERIYIILLEEFDPAEAETDISEDWENDTKGQPGLSFEGLGDSLFEASSQTASN